MRKGFCPIRPQFIACSGDPTADHGNDAECWGIWRVDPGPRGLPLQKYRPGMKSAPAGWNIDASSFWMEEHGLLMESPEFPLPPGRYLVTGYRAVTTVLTVSSDGSWRLDEGTLYDVIHLPCRSAKYEPINFISGAGGPENANTSDFPVKPGEVMPDVPACKKSVYGVIFIIGVPEIKRQKNK